MSTSGEKKVVSNISVLHLGQEIRCATSFCANAQVHRYQRFGKETSTHRTKGSNCLTFEVSNWNMFILTKSILLYTETIRRLLSTKKVMKKVIYKNIDISLKHQGLYYVIVSNKLYQERNICFALCMFISCL